MTNNVIGFEALKNAQAIERVIDAVVIQGPAPFVHLRALDKLKKEWPSLYNALRELVVTYSVPVLNYYVVILYRFPPGSFDIITDHRRIIRKYGTLNEMVEAHSVAAMNLKRLGRSRNCLISGYTLRMEVTHTEQYEENHYGKR